MADDIYDRPKGAFDRIRTILVGVLVGMLVLAFAVWGIEDVFSPNSSNAVVAVGEAEVGREDFLDRFNEEMRRVQEQTGEGLTPQQAFDRGIPQRLVGEFTQQLAIEADADDLGIGVNNRDVARYAQNIDAFRNTITQEFDRAQLQRVLASNRMTERDFEEGIANVLRQQQTLPAIMGGIVAPSDYAQSYNQFVNESRSARLLRFGAEHIDPVPEPTDDELRSFIAENQASFTAPEYRRFLMLRVEPFDFRQDIEVTEEQLQERFETLVGAGEIGAVETRDVSVIVAPTREVADAIAARISAGEDAAVVAADLGLPAPDDFNGIGENGLINPDTSVAAFELEPGMARVAETGFGTFDVVTVRSISPAETPTLEDMRDELAEDVLNGQALRRINDIERVIDDRLLEGATIEEIAEGLDLPLSAYPFIDRSGVTPDGVRLSGISVVPGIATDDRLLQAVFTGDIGFESDIVPTSNGGLAIFRITDTIDSAPRPLDMVREDATRLWKTRALSDALNAKGVELARRVREGETLEALGQELGGLIVQPVSIMRASPNAELSPAVTITLLDGEPGTVARGAGRNPGTYEIAVLDAISTQNERISGNILDVIREQVSEQVALDISRAYQDAIIDDKTQRVYEGQLRAALNIEAEG
ncbi:MAG: SurA N-terminal domain-containing protein [Pseudomonadota bacterium]